ncbi:MAG: GAF domain-containing sensor histidine kinase, partial [Pseudomonadota bacterium]
SQGYKRVRILLITDDGKFFESYRIRPGTTDELGNFGGTMESLESAGSLSQVIADKRSGVFVCDNMSSAPCWQRPEGDSGNGPVEYGLVPMIYRDLAIGALYVDNWELPTGDMDIDRPPAQITVDRLERLLGFAQEGARAIVESKEMEKARQGIRLLEMDKEILREPDIPELLHTLLKNSIELMREQRERRILPADPPDVSGEVTLIEGIRLVTKSTHFHPSPASPKNWHTERDAEVLSVKVFKTGEPIVYNNLSAEKEWAEYLTALEHKDWVTHDYVKYQQSLQSYACFPLKVGDQTIGTLCLQSPTSHQFDDVSLGVLQAFVNRTSKAMERHLRTAEVNRMGQMYSAMALTRSQADQNDIDRTIFAFLTGLTHREGMAFNRAIYLEPEGDYLIEKRAIGPRNRDEGEELYARLDTSDSPSLKDSLKENIRFNSVPCGIPQISIAKVPTTVCSFKPSDSPPAGLFDVPDCCEFYFVPFMDGNEFMSAVLLDNFITGKKLSYPEVEVLKSVALDYSTLFKSHRMIRKLEDEARKDELMHVLSHRLKTDVSGPYSLIKRALEKGRSLHTEECSLIASKLWNTSKAIRDLLQFSVIESGNLKDQAHFDAYDLKDLVTELVEESFLSQAHRVTVTAHFSGRVQCDREKLSHAFLNILENAILYSKPDSTVEVSLQSVDNTCTQIVITVLNVPIDPIDNEDPRLWLGKYSRGENGKHAKGTGLGLYIADHIARLHGGGIDVSSLNDGKVAVSLVIQATPPGKGHRHEDLPA